MFHNWKEYLEDRKTPSKMKLGWALNNARGRKKLSRAAAAKAIGASPEEIKRLELSSYLGTPSGKTLFRLFDFYLMDSGLELRKAGFKMEEIRAIALETGYSGKERRAFSPTYPTTNRLGALLRQKRNKAGLTLAVLSSIIGKSPQYISGIERGEAKLFPKAKTLMALSSTLRVKYGRIMKLAGYPPIAKYMSSIPVSRYGIPLRGIRSAKKIERDDIPLFFHVPAHYIVSLERGDLPNLYSYSTTRRIASVYGLHWHFILGASGYLSLGGAYGKKKTLSI